MLLAGAHLLLSGAALSSLSTLAEHRHLLGSAATALPFGTFAGLLLYGIAGSLRYAFPNTRNITYINKFLVIIQMIARSLALPCVVTYLYIMLGYSPAVAYIHLISGFVPVLLFLLKFGVDAVTDVVLAANIASLVYISYLFGNMWGIGLGVCQLLNHFCLNLFEDILTAPIDCLFVVGMCFFNIFAIKTVKNY